jgi:outer membrane protein assembly factor BamB
MVELNSRFVMTSHFRGLWGWARRLWSLCHLGLLLTLPAAAQEWTRFRGPNGSGISLAQTIPTKWSAPHLRWKTALPGVGHSSPVLWGQRLFITSADEATGRFYILALDAQDGSVLWRREFPFTPFPKHQYNSFASSTPTVDAERVYVAWTTPAHHTLAAFDHAGRTLWELDLGPFVSQHNGGTSPILHDGKVILANEQDGESFLAAIEAATGKWRWKTPRVASRAAYSTPCLWTPPKGKPVLIFNSQSHGISAIDPDTGGVVWAFSQAFDKRSVSSPVIAAGLILGSCGSGGGGNYLVALRPGDPAAGRPPELAWQVRRSAPYVPTSLAVGELVFLWSDGGIVSCVHAPTGEVKYQERVGGDYFGSPVWVDGRLFNVSAGGEVVVVKAAEDFEVLARFALNELCRSTPAVANERMFIHTASHLWCIGQPDATEAPATSR